jgi:aspartate/methionine/tyrosine aminotransferase
MPEGAFYAFLDVREKVDGVRFKVSADVADFMLEKAHVVATDGAAFGAEGFLRLSYATSMENLHTAVERLTKLFGDEAEANAAT